MHLSIGVNALPAEDLGLRLLAAVVLETVVGLSEEEAAAVTAGKASAIVRLEDDPIEAFRDEHRMRSRLAAYCSGDLFTCMLVPDLDEAASGE